MHGKRKSQRKSVRGSSGQRFLPENSQALPSQARPPLRLLSGIRILSFTQFLLGPAAVQYLSDLGAEVIKVEAPGTGAWERSWSGADAFVNGISAFFLLAHRNARSLTLNLKHPEGVAIAHRLVTEADVLVENFRPGVMERLGLGYEQMKALNPRLIYASASGYGADSPSRDLPGQDLLIQAVSGLAAATGRAGDLPTPAGAAVVDQHGAALLAMAILAALVHRERTGEGQQIEVTMLQAALDLQSEPLVYFVNGGFVQRPQEPLGSSFHPAPYGIYRTQDGYLALSLSPVARVSAALGDPPELTPYLDPQIALRQRDEIRRALDPFFRTRTTQEWLEQLRTHGVWCAPVHDYPAALADPAIQHLDPVMEVDHPQAGPIRLLKHPVRYSSGEPQLRHLPPALGANTDQVLTSLGYTPDEIARLRQDGVI